jgi:aminopeptidase N
VQSLAANGAIDVPAIDAELDRDPSAAGQRDAATARALLPTPEAKAEAWRLALHDDALPNAMQKAVIGGFAHPTQSDLIAPYMQRYFEEVADLWERRTSELAQSAVVGLFPSWHATIAPGTVAAADAFLAGPDVPSALRRLVLEGRSDVVRALRAREVDAAAS